MAQPAVSIAVRKLESELDVCLFDRSGRRATLTAEGHNLLSRAQAILAQVAELKRSTSDMKDLLQGELRIACPSMLATYYLPQVLTGFLGQHPGLQASVIQAGTAQVEQMLLDDAIEIGVTTSRDPDTAPGLDMVPLTSQDMVLCMSATHPWVGRRAIDVEDLHRSPMVVYESGYFIRSRLDQLCRERGIAPDYRMQSNFLPLLIRMVKQGMGTTVGLDVMAAEEHGLTGVPLAPRTVVSMSLARRRGRSISLANQAFMDWVAAGFP
ncbi:MAG: LysR family transcriptional regulator [Halioglobus sp.]|nr:LysR family transcriptional regulator [Halioglobus sp.]